VAIPVGHEIALSLPLLAMTKEMRHCEPFSTVIASRRRGNLGKSKTQKSNGKTAEQKSNNQHAKRGRVIAF